MDVTWCCGRGLVLACLQVSHELFLLDLHSELVRRGTVHQRTSADHVPKHCSYWSPKVTKALWISFSRLVDCMQLCVMPAEQDLLILNSSSLPDKKLQTQLAVVAACLPQPILLHPNFYWCNKCVFEASHMPPSPHYWGPEWGVMHWFEKNNQTRG